MRRIVLAVLAAVTLFPGAARAGSASTTFTVTATVTNNCTITGPAGNNVTFGSWDMSAAKSVTGVLTVACTKGASYSMTLASANGWTMKGAGTDALTYLIYQPDASGNAATTTQWDATHAYSYASTSRAAKGLTLTATVQPGDVAAGAFTDTVTATINF
jgi:spore coat protein U-like protein